MRLDRATELIKRYAEQMNARCERVIFDEWAIFSLAQGKGRLLSYIGPRRRGFQKNLLSNVATLQVGLIPVNYAVGDFQFAQEGEAQAYHAVMVVGRGLYLVCNNTVQSMDGFVQSPFWLVAQVFFTELSDKFRAHPLELARCQCVSRVTA